MIIVGPKQWGCRGRGVDFIFMLTRQDQTVEDCLEVVDTVIETGVRHIGFKDVGVERTILRELNRRICDAGAVSYMSYNFV